MFLFWIICTLFLVVALVFVVLPLLRANVSHNAIERDGANLEIIRDQLAEIDSDLSNGLLTQEMHAQGKGELQSRLLDEVGDKQIQSTMLVRNSSKILALALSVLLPLAVVGVYWKVGNRHALLQQNKSANVDMSGDVQAPVSINALEEMVSNKPQDPNPLVMLARSYSDLGRFVDAAVAYEKLTKLVPDESQLWADYADALAMSAGRKLMGPPAKLIEKALALDPNNFKALALTGSVAMERGDFAAAASSWEKLLTLIPKDDQNVKDIEGGIQQARVLLAQKSGVKMPVQATQVGDRSESAQAGKEAISGTVTLSNAFKAHVSPEDTVFVLVRAAEGPKMPLAIVRKQVKDLPIKFSLDDNAAMSPQMKVSNFEQVVVIARVSKSGNAMTQPGDIQGMSNVIKPGTSGLKLSIDKVLQ